MSGPLRGALTALVLLNLVFVQLTEAVDPRWLPPMQIAVLLSPFGVRLQRRLWWRLGWNLGVLAIFGILVRDVTQSGPRHLLEDGLLLAAFCQVHLLNALRDDQRPDLLFFNSFLIALVTSFFCQDLAFSLTFAVYALCFVAALALAADRGRRPAVRVVRRALGQALALLAVTGLSFAFVPRDFRREGLVDEQALGSLVGAQRSGFRDTVELGRAVRSTSDEGVVMRIRVRAGDPAAVPSLWRGAVLERHEADGWRRRLRLRSEHPLSIRWPADGIGSWRRPGVAGAEVLAEVVVDCEDPRQAILFAPLEALGLTVPTGASPDAVYARSDGVFQRRLPPGVRTAGGFRYAVALGADGPAVGAADAETCAPFVRLDRDDTRAVPAVAHDLLRDALRGLGPDPSQAEVVESCRALLAGRFDYRLPGADGAADGLSTFLAGEGGGHCELFATGLALLLRLRGIPCRLATGFLVDEWDAEQRSFVVRNRHAHAWVEVYDAGRQTWHAVDPTPAADGPEPAADGLLAALTAPFRALWRSVTTFDAAARGTLLDAVRHAPGRALAAVRSAPWASLALAAGLLALGAALRRRRRRRAADPVLAYQRLLRELRIRRHPEETPRELLARAAPTLGDRGRIDALERATQAHEAARFGRSAVARS